VQTNILFFNVDPSWGTAGDLVDRLKKKGILVLAESARRIRAVTHLGVDREQVEEASQVIQSLFV